MGIKGFNSWIKSRYPLCYTETQYHLPKLDYVYIDLNSFIHTFFRETKKRKYNYQSSLKTLCQFLDYVLKKCKPTKLYFIAIDGVAPLAKLKQQRDRRFDMAKKDLNRNSNTENSESESGNEDESEVETELENKKQKDLSSDEPNKRQKKAEGENLIKDSFSSIHLTPGTPFMRKLNHDLYNYIHGQINSFDISFKERNPWRSVPIVFSNSDVPGEGEHKIMDHIRQLKQDMNIINQKFAIFGDDADLILLAIATHLPNLILANPVVGKCSLQKMRYNTVMLQITYISMLRSCIQHEFHTKSATFKINPENIIDDFVLLSTLVGNDFLPHIRKIKIEGHGLDKIFEAYARYLEIKGGHLLCRGKILWDNLFSLLTYWSPVDPIKFADDPTLILIRNMALFARTDNKYIDIDHPLTFHGRKLLFEWCTHLNWDLKLISPFNESTEMLLKKFETADHDVISLMNEAIINPKIQLMKKNYQVDKMPNVYAPISNIPEKYMPEYKPFLSNIEASGVILENCIDYLKGLQWVMYYYYRGVPDWTFFCKNMKWLNIEDLLSIRLLPNYQEILNFKYELGKPLLPYTLLLALLPRNYAYLIPKKLQPIMLDQKSKMYDYYDPTGSKLLCLDLLRECINEYYIKLDESDKILNKWSNAILFETFNHLVHQKCFQVKMTSLLDFENNIPSYYQPELTWRFCFPTLDEFPLFVATQTLGKAKNKPKGELDRQMFGWVMDILKDCDVEMIAKAMLGKEFAVGWPNPSFSVVVRLDTRFKSFELSHNNKSLNITEHPPNKRAKLETDLTNLGNIYLKRYGLNIGLVQCQVWFKNYRKRSIIKAFNTKKGMAPTMVSIPLQLVTLKYMRWWKSGDGHL